MKSLLIGEKSYERGKKIGKRKIVDVKVSDAVKEEKIEEAIEEKTA